MRTSNFPAFINWRDALLALALCGAAALVQAQTADTLSKVSRSGVFTIGYRESSIPFSYLDAQARPTGIGWEICQRIAERVKLATGRSDLKVAGQAVTSANRVPLVQNGTVDIECGSTTNNSERGKQVQFAINYFYTGTRFLVRSASGIKSLADLRGKQVVVTAGTTNMRVMRRVDQEQGLGLQILSAKDHAEAALLVESGRADAFAMDDILLYGLKAMSRQSDQLAVVGEAIQVEPYAFMLRKDDPVFHKLVNDTLAEMMRNGEFEQLYAKWFLNPIPPTGMRLHAPMSEALKSNLQALSDQPAT
jgi:ABC-type amino acid transport substrate-binding protein